MKVIKQELEVMQISIETIFSSHDFNEAAKVDTTLVQALLTINDALDTIAERAGGSV